jgi:hypothetical protein
VKCRDVDQWRALVNTVMIIGFRNRRVICRLLELLSSSQNGLLLHGISAVGYPWRWGGHLKF